jgi:hypothetical protein
MGRAKPEKKLHAIMTAAQLEEWVLKLPELDAAELRRRRNRRRRGKVAKIGYRP